MILIKIDLRFFTNNVFTFTVLPYLIITYPTSYNRSGKKPDKLIWF